MPPFFAFSHDLLCKLLVALAHVCYNAAMTLEFEKLTADVEQMGLSVREQQQQQEEQLAAAIGKMSEFAHRWEDINQCLDAVSSHAPAIRLARPIEDDQPLNARIELPPCPAQATIFATDGSQILPSRHNPYLYYLLNIGGITYYHGQDQIPEQYTQPTLKYEPTDLLMDENIVSGTVVSARRDVEEITALADQAFANREAIGPRLAVLD